MIIVTLVFSLIVTLCGLLSLTLVTDVPMREVIFNTQMMGVFFVTGVLLALLSYFATMVTVYNRCISKKCNCENANET
jgi:hypothetical protein